MSDVSPADWSGRIVPAVVSDIPQIRNLITPFAEAGLMLPKNLTTLYDTMRDFVVCRDAEGKVIGTGALHVVWEDWAEVRSLAVDKEYHGSGLGKSLISHLLNEARTLGVKRVFTLTYVDHLFLKFGFQPIDKNLLPRKVWAECVNCPKFPNCDEIALSLDLPDDAPSNS